MRPALFRPLLLLGATITLLMIGQAILPGFLSSGQIANQLKIAAFLGLFGLCQTIVISAGGQGLDLSVGAVATLGGVIGAAIMHGADIMTPLGALAALGCGLVVGAVNGFGIARLGIPPLVATLAMASVVDGGVIVGVTLSQPSNTASPVLTDIAGWGTCGVPNIVLLWAAVTLVALWIIDRSAWGRRMCATGANATAALLSGTDTARLRIGVYTLSGGTAALGGFLLTGYVGQAFFGLGNPYILTSIVVAAIGGVSLAGGRAPYLGVACAAIMMTVLISLLTAISMGESGRQIIFGCTLLAFLTVERHAGTSWKRLRGARPRSATKAIRSRADREAA